MRARARSHRRVSAHTNMARYTFPKFQFFSRRRNDEVFHDDDDPIIVIPKCELIVVMIFFWHQCSFLYLIMHLIMLIVVVFNHGNPKSTQKQRHPCVQKLQSQQSLLVTQDKTTEKANIPLHTDSYNQWRSNPLNEPIANQWPTFIDKINEHILSKDVQVCVHAGLWYHDNI